MAAADTLTFDVELVRRWFGLLVGPDEALLAPDRDAPAGLLGGAWAGGSAAAQVQPFWGVQPTAEEREVLAHGGRIIAAAVARADLPRSVPAAPAPAAALLQAYLTGLATGIAGTRQALQDGQDIGESTMADRLCLVAGLIAGGAALQVAPGDPGVPAAGRADRLGRDAADLARVAGTSAAELVVDGADLHAITSAAAAAALATGPADGANRDPRYRARALIALVLVALHLCTAPMAEPSAPPSCGAAPGANAGAALLAEVTFTVFLAQPDSDRLARAVDGLADEVVVWSEGDRRYFHVHTRVPGEVIAEAYAIGSVFSLVIGRL